MPKISLPSTLVKLPFLHFHPSLFPHQALPARLRFPSPFHFSAVHYPGPTFLTPSALCPLLCLCTVLCCLALCTAEVSHFFIASFVWLDLVKKVIHVFSLLFHFFGVFFLFFPFFTVSLFPSCHSSLATAKYLPPLNIIMRLSTLPYAEIVSGFSV